MALTEPQQRLDWDTAWPAAREPPLKDGQVVQGGALFESLRTARRVTDALMAKVGKLVRTIRIGVGVVLCWRRVVWASCCVDRVYARAQVDAGMQCVFLDHPLYLDLCPHSKPTAALALTTSTRPSCACHASFGQFAPTGTQPRAVHDGVP